MERRAIAVRGIVQGVGFRPFVYGLASELSLGGFVRNVSGMVQIEVEGEAGKLDLFLEQLTSRAPAPARIEEVTWCARPVKADRSFVIEASGRESEGVITIAPDVATCDACLEELFNPEDRRYRYPFTNCTNCGPRLSIVTGAPYDRARTTMSGFAMCSACRAEYENPADRRFHAQPIACPVCGPQLRALDGGGKGVAAADPLSWFIGALRAGKIGAMKGLGGYHLICDATDGTAVAELRRRKQRDEKPFAVMVLDVAVAGALCEIDAAEKKLLKSGGGPIVLLKKRAGISLAENVARGNGYLGVMLPYTPLHHLLMRDIGVPLVMTSGNRSDEPIAYQEPDAIERLGGIADVFLVHNRSIHVRCDDSVIRVNDNIETPIRRSRGYAPAPIRLPAACPMPVLAVGGQMKSTFALGVDQQAVLSQHMGDLDHFEASRSFERDVELYEQLFSVSPKYIVHDLHPDYASTRYALRRAAAENIPLLGVQHHHAHMASCMAEHGLCEAVVGVIWDGTGYGTDGTIWGGEFLLGDAKDFRRIAHLKNVALPGGERAVREPWRMAAAYLRKANAECARLENRIEARAWKTVGRMVDRGFNAPLTSSAGRLFDAVASLAGVRDYASYEGQAAIELEMVARGIADEQIYGFEISDAESGAWVIDVDRMIGAIAVEVTEGETAERISRRFHSTLCEIILTVCRRARTRYGISCVVLSGGVFMNTLLSGEVSRRLAGEGFRVYSHRIVPPNDGGISLGQLAVAASKLTPA